MFAIAKRPFVWLCVVAGIAAPLATARAECDVPDAPDCACFVDVASWDAGGPIDPGVAEIIQDVALDTAGTPESCNCPGTFGCTWDPDPSSSDHDFENAGKPYFQMVLGSNSRDDALWLAHLLSVDTYVELRGRAEWCSETISYWHRESRHPYQWGYRTTWHEDWMVPTVLDLRSWYMTEENLFEETGYGRGRWLASTVLDYTDFRPGLNAPLPGAYVAIAQYRYSDSSWPDHTYSHSLMVDEMTVHRDWFGNVCQVEVSLLEGNSQDRVRDDRDWADVLSLTPQGSQWVSTWSGPDGIAGNADDVNRKIYGFGIDLDFRGEPIYDAARLHEVTEPSICGPIRTHAVATADPGWDEVSPTLPALAGYAAAVVQQGGPTLRLTGGPVLPLPDGDPSRKQPFAAGFTGEALVDLKGAHPLPIRGVELVWGPGSLPRGYTAEFLLANQQSAPGVVPLLANVVPPPGASVPVPVLLDEPRTGVQLVRLFFPPGSVTAEAVLRDVRFVHEPTRWADAPSESVQVQIPVFVDVKPGSCPNPFRPGTPGVIPVAVLGSGSFDVRSIAPPSVRLGGVAPLRWAYSDVATPFVGPVEQCHARGRDGRRDLILTFDARAVEKALGLASRVGQKVPALVTGSLKSDGGGAVVLGQDWIKVIGK